MSKKSKSTSVFSKGPAISAKGPNERYLDSEAYQKPLSKPSGGKYAPGNTYAQDQKHYIIQKGKAQRDDKAGPDMRDATYEARAGRALNRPQLLGKAAGMAARSPEGKALGGAASRAAASFKKIAGKVGGAVKSTASAVATGAKGLLKKKSK